MLATPSGSAARVQEGDGEIEITVEVLPPSNPGTVSAALTEPGNPVSGATGAPDSPESFDLIVADDRGSGDGWQVQVMQAPLETPAEGLTLPRQRYRTEVLVGQPTQGMLGPRWNRLAAGQALDRPIPVLVASPGAGAGVYRHPLDVALPGERAETEAYQLVVTISSAP